MFHGTISNPKPFLIQHVAFILLSKITPCGIIIYKLSLFSTLIHGEMKEEGAWWVRGKGGGREGEGGQSKRLQVSVIKLLHSHVLVYKSQEAGKRGGDTRAIRFFLLYLSLSPLFFFRRFIISGFHHFVSSR